MAQLLCVNKCSVISVIGVPFVEGYQALDWVWDFIAAVPAHRVFSSQPAHVGTDVLVFHVLLTYVCLTRHVDSVQRVAVALVYLGGTEDTPVIKFE